MNTPLSSKRPELRRDPAPVRLAAAAAALFATLVAVGSQLGLVAMYSGEADEALVRLQPAPAASQSVAGASRWNRRSQSVALAADPGGGPLWPWVHAPARDN